MDTLITGWRAVSIILRCGFLLVLAVASWQDLRGRSIKVWVFAGFGGAGAVLRCIQLMLEIGMACQGKDMYRACCLMGERLFDMGLAMAIGTGLLYLSWVTGEAVGRGDGWFFVISGLYLGAVRNLLLLAGGLGACFLMCLLLVIRNMAQGRPVREIRRLRLPFLPFLLPSGIGVMFL